MPSISREHLKDLLIFLSLAALQCLVFLPLAQERLIARDEGFYVYAAKLINHGKLPYIDFFYPQMPILPFIYGGWMQMFGETWYSARLFSALLAVAVGLLCSLYSRLLLGRTAAIAAGLLYTSSISVIPWYLTVQTYALSTLFLFMSCILLRFPPIARKSPVIVAAGIAFGLAVNVRLFFGALGPVIILYILGTEGPLKKRIGDVMLFSSGTLIGMLPSFAYLIADFDRFYFNNLGYHLNRSTMSTRESLENKLAILRVFLGLKDSIKFGAPQPALLLYASFFGGLIALLTRKKIDLMLYVAAALFLINFIPTPTYVQYLAPLIPFLIVSSLVFIASLWNLSEQRLARPLVVALALSCLTLYTWNVPGDIERYTRTGEGVIGFRTEENAAHWNLKTVTEISATVKKISKPGDVILSSWSGYLLETEGQPYPGLENHFGITVANRLSKPARKKYGLIGEKEINEAIKSGSSEIVLYASSGKRARGRMRDLMRHYDIVKLQGPIAIHKKRAEE